MVADVTGGGSTRGQEDGQTLPWRLTEEGVLWFGGSPTQGIYFDSSGMHFGLERGASHYTWSEILNITFQVPYSSITCWKIIEVINFFNTRISLHSSRDMQVCVAFKSRDAQFNLGRSGRYSWRLNLVLSDLVDLLSARNSLRMLGDGQLMTYVGDLANSVPFFARAVMYVDLFGLEKVLKGYGAYKGRIAEYIDSR